jgi:hypothetical protein
MPGLQKENLHGTVYGSLGRGDVERRKVGTRVLFAVTAATVLAVVMLANPLFAGGHSHARIKRSIAAKHEFWRESGHLHGWPGHVVDHITPLACGGADAPSNMQWETVTEAKAKDRWERRGCR